MLAAVQTRFNFRRSDARHSMMSMRSRRETCVREIAAVPRCRTPNEDFVRATAVKKAQRM